MIIQERTGLNRLLVLIVAFTVPSIAFATDARITWDLAEDGWTPAEQAILARGAVKALHDVPQCHSIVSGVAEMHFNHYTIDCNCDELLTPRNPQCFSIEFTEQQSKSKKPFIYRPTIAVAKDEGIRQCTTMISNRLANPKNIQWGDITADVANSTQNLSVSVRGLVPASKAYGAEWGFRAECIIDGKYHEAELSNFDKWRIGQ